MDVPIAIHTCLRFYFLRIAVRGLSEQTGGGRAPGTM